MDKVTLYLDSETIPGPESGKDDVIVKAPANYKKQEAIDRYIAEHKEEAYLKQSFNGGYGQICSFSFAVDDGPVWNDNDDGQRDCERDVLLMAFDTINKELSISGAGDPVPTLCGHYISGFDLRFIMHRCIVHGIKIPPWLKANAKPWDARIRDTMLLWAGHGNRIGLDELCKILGVEGKGDMDGSQVYEYWKAGRHDEIAAYCNSDVEKVREIDLIFKRAGI